MAFTIANKVAGGPGNNTPTSSAASASFAASTGNSIVVGIGILNSGDPATLISSVRDTAGNTYNAVAGTDAVGAGLGVCTIMFLAQNIVGNAANVVTVNFASAVVLPTLYVWEVNCGAGNQLVKDVAAIGKSGVNGSSTNNSTAAFTTTIAAEICLAFTANSIGGLTYSGGSGYTLDSGTITGATTTSASEHQIFAATQTGIVANFTATANNNWVISAASFSAQLAPTGAGIGSTKTSGASTPSTVTNGPGAALAITSPTVTTKLGQPIPIVFCDKDGNELSVTGATTGAQVGSPCPVVLCTSTGLYIPPTLTLTSNGHSIVVTATKTGVKYQQPTPVCISDPNGFAYLISGFSTFGAFIAGPLPICLTDVNGNILTLTIGN
jgi:hypothetical protein